MASLYPLDCDWACLDGDRFSGSHRIRDCPPPSFWLALALFYPDHHLWCLPITGAHASRISKDRGHRINLDPHDPCNFWLSGIPIETRYRRNLRWLPPSKRGARNRSSKRKWSLNLGAWNHRGNSNAPQPLSPLFHFANAKGGLQRSSRYQTGSALYDLGFKYWIEFGLRRQLPPLDSWSSPLLWSRR